MMLLLFPISCAIIVYLLISAPEGYEDDTGFHIKQSPKRYK